MELLLDLHSRMDVHQEELEVLRQSKCTSTNDQGAPSGNQPGSSTALAGKHQPDPVAAAKLAKDIDLGELSEQVQARITRRVQQLPLQGLYMTDTSTNEEEDAACV